MIKMYITRILNIHEALGLNPKCHIPISFKNYYAYYCNMTAKQMRDTNSYIRKKCYDKNPSNEFFERFYRYNNQI